MRLKRLEISGFKSFAKPTTLEFPVAVSAIVGPNGSGKSNVAEAIRWVLGEQSMKSLRGKRGEDLIFNGSTSSPRLGKAGVALTFDNADGRIPLDFPEVKIERRIFRDGTNEYLLNDSAVRLKDIILLVARIGLGETKHNIIGQGEVDRWLLSNARDRKEILEEALGLKVYQIKKSETERKLASTEENMREVEAVLREVVLHLRFLKHQAEKAETRNALEKELQHLARVYFAKRFHDLDTAKVKMNAEASPLEKELSLIERRIGGIRKEIELRESHGRDEAREALLEKDILATEGGRQDLERRLGHIEGKTAALRERAAKPLVRITDASYVKEKIAELLLVVREALAPGENFESRLQKIQKDLEILHAAIERGSVEMPPDEGVRGELRALERELRALEDELGEVKQRLGALRDSREKSNTEARTIEAELRVLEREFRAAESSRAEVASRLERSTFERERIAIEEVELSKEMKLANVEKKELSSVEQSHIEAHVDSQELFKKIERLRGKLEEVGGIDVSVIKEYQETESRHAFLTKELEDLREAMKSLKELVGTLERQIEDDFERGFKKINEGFNHYFQLIFGGGKAKLSYQELRTKDQGLSGEAGPHEEEVEYGVDIDVDLPRKRIKSLSMLSGGERALTSIALLFAMVSVNPPPFLVLDETDAALDEANSQKYAKTLSELSEQSQLIIITHNRETMLHAGILYGVTMGDDGISKLLSIKFEEGERYVNR